MTVKRAEGTKDVAVFEEQRSRHPDLSASRRWFGESIRTLRKRRSLTLQELSRRAGLAVSSLSKIENGKVSVTYDNIVALAHGLESDVSALLSPSDNEEMIGRRAITKSGAGFIYETEHYRYQVLCAEISRKKIIPLRAIVKAHSIFEFGNLTKHSGEEFILVLKGAVRVFTEGYQPTVLSVGDSIYFDSMMGHAVINCSAEPAEIIWACTNPDFLSESVPQSAQTN